VYKFLDRCKTSGYKGIYLAVDSPVLGKRERDMHHGHGTPRLKINMALSSLSKPKWLFRFLTSPKLVVGNMTEYLPHGGDLQKVVDTINGQYDASVSWEDAKAIKDYWGEGPFLLKGIQSVEDAKKAVDIGASGIVLSNHGGRQLDGAPTALELLPRVKDAVKDQLEILIDGGITRGADIIKAIALGADACMIGRAYLYGLAAGGENGVDRALSILKEEMERVMALIGCNDINNLDSSYIERLSPIP
jgi:L-lactate dehydrogenase (cytochrome)